MHFNDAIDRSPPFLFLLGYLSICHLSPTFSHTNQRYMKFLHKIATFSDNLNPLNFSLWAPTLRSHRFSYSIFAQQPKKCNTKSAILLDFMRIREKMPQMLRISISHRLDAQRDTHWVNYMTTSLPFNLNYIAQVAWNTVSSKKHCEIWKTNIKVKV